MLFWLALLVAFSDGGGVHAALDAARQTLVNLVQAPPPQTVGTRVLPLWRDANPDPAVDEFKRQKRISLHVIGVLRRALISVSRQK